MNRYRTIPGLSGPPKATATTVCQKCLKKDKFLGNSTVWTTYWRPLTTLQLRM